MFVALLEDWCFSVLSRFSIYIDSRFGFCGCTGKKYVEYRIQQISTLVVARQTLLLEHYNWCAIVQHFAGNGLHKNIVQHSQRFIESFICDIKCRFIGSFIFFPLSCRSVHRFIAQMKPGTRNSNKNRRTLRHHKWLIINWAKYWQVSVKYTINIFFMRFVHIVLPIKLWS